MGILLDELGRKEEALSDYKKAVLENPNKLNFRHSLGWEYFVLQKIKKAKEQY